MQILDKLYLSLDPKLSIFIFLTKLYQHYIPVYFLGDQPVLQIGLKVEICDDARPSFDNNRVFSYFLS